MKFLVSAALAAGDQHSIEPWLDVKNPVFEGDTPLGVFLLPDDVARYAKSDIAKVMDLLNVPVSNGQTLEAFRAAAVAARIELLIDDANSARAAAAALRKDFMQLQENFLMVEGFLNGALAPKFTLARQWDFSGNTVELKAGETLDQMLPISSAALVAVDIWMVSGQALVSLLRPDQSEFLAPIKVSGIGWQRVQFSALSGNTDGVSLVVEAAEDCVLGISYPSPLPEFGDTPLALRLWKGLSGVRLPNLPVSAGIDQRGFIMPANLPTALVLDSGSTKYLETGNILMIHTDYYGAANLALRDVGLGEKCSAYLQNCGPETLEVMLCQVSAGAVAPAKHCPSVFLAPEAYMQCDVPFDGPDAVDLIVKIKGRTSLDCLSIRGFEIG